MGVEGESWQYKARCRSLSIDPEIFFPQLGGSIREAIRVCEPCPVRLECLEYALRIDERYGVWGGKSNTQRGKLRRLWQRQQPIPPLSEFLATAQI